jgi:hypothetical protein
VKRVTKRDGASAAMTCDDCGAQRVEVVCFGREQSTSLTTALSFAKVCRACTLQALALFSDSPVRASAIVVDGIALSPVEEMIYSASFAYAHEIDYAEDGVRVYRTVGGREHEKSGGR